jgi:hypothetical protein
MNNLIELHGKKIYFKNIVGYGCSFMAGAECCDDIMRIDMDLTAVNEVKLTNGRNMHRFYQEYTKPEYIEKGLINPYFLTNNQFDWNKVRDHEKKNSWFNLLAENFEGTHRNMSVSGESFSGMQHRHMKDVAENAISDEDLIIIGLTSITRFFYIDNSGKKCNSLIGWPNIGWPTLNSGDIDEDFYKKYISYLGSSNNLLWDMLRSIYYFKNLKNPVIFVPQFVTYYLDDDVNYDPTIKHLMESFLKSSELIPLTMNFPNMLHDEFFYGPCVTSGIPSTSMKMSGLHPSRPQHQKFAANIYNYLKCDNNGK